LLKKIRQSIFKEYKVQPWLKCQNNESKFWLMKEFQIHFISFEKEKRINFFRVKQGTKRGQPLSYFYILVRIVKKVKTVNTCFKRRLLDLKIVALFLQSWVVQKKTQKDLMIKLRLWLKGQNCWLNFFLLFQLLHQQKNNHLHES